MNIVKKNNAHRRAVRARRHRSSVESLEHRTLLATNVPPVGALVAGVVTETFGLRPALIVAGTAYLLTTLAPFVFPAWRQMRRPEPSVSR